MDMIKDLKVLVICSTILVVTHSDTNIHKTGYLDRVVEYFKERFIADVHEKLPPIEFKADLVKAPKGYKDSKNWDYDSVIRLLKLIRTSKKTRPLAQVLRRALQPTLAKSRRVYMSKQNSYLKFPKHPSDQPTSLDYERLNEFLVKINPQNVFYEDSYYDEYGIVEDEEFNNRFDVGDSVEDDAVVVIANPVESRLPSAHISVRMLREILEARAEAARVMPPTEKSTIYWKPMSSSGDGSTGDGAEGAEGANGSDASTAADGAGNDTTAGEGGGDASADPTTEPPPAE